MLARWLDPAIARPVRGRRLETFWSISRSQTNDCGWQVYGSHEVHRRVLPTQRLGAQLRGPRGRRQPNAEMVLLRRRIGMATLRKLESRSVAMHLDERSTLEMQCDGVEEVASFRREHRPAVA